MKILSPKEISDRRQVEGQRDIEKIASIKKILDEETKKLNEVDARFNLALANQRLRWAAEEQAALEKIKVLTDEVAVLEAKLVPIEDRERKSHTLLTEAEKMAEILQEKLDDVSDRETDVALREQQVLIKEQSVEAEKAMLKASLQK